MRRILRIPLRLQRSSWCGGSAASNDSSWLPPVVMGGVEEGVKVWVGVWRRGEGENHVFHAEKCIYNLQISLSKLILLSGSSLFVLSVTIRAEHNSLCVNSRSVQFPLGLELCLAH